MKKIKKNKRILRKEYIKEIIEFFNKKLKYKTIILVFLMLFFLAITIVPVMKQVMKYDYQNININSETTLWILIKDKLLITLITVIAGLVPYMYIPVVACLGYMYQIIIEFSYIIINRGFVLGSILVFIPLLLNVLSISLVGAVGIYLCKINTNKFTSSQQKNMNWNNFILNIYQITKNKEKEKAMQKKIDAKLKKIDKMETNINYKQIINIGIVVVLLQTISCIIEYIII